MMMGVNRVIEMKDILDGVMEMIMGVNEVMEMGMSWMGCWR